MDRRTRVLVVAIVVSFIAFLDGAVINVALPVDRGGARRRTRAAAVGGRRLPADARLAHPARRARCRTPSAGSGSSASASTASPRPRCSARSRRRARVRHRARPAGRGGRAARAEFARAHHRDVPASRAGPRDRALDGVDHQRVPHRPAARRRARRPRSRGGSCSGSTCCRSRSCSCSCARSVATTPEPEPRAHRLARRGARRHRARRHGVRAHRAGALRLGSPVVFVPLVVGLVALVAFVLWERRAPQPMLPLSLFRARNFAAGNLATRLHLRVVLARAVRDDDLPAGDRRASRRRWPGSRRCRRRSCSCSSAHGSADSPTRFGPRIFMTLGPIIVARRLPADPHGRPDLNYWLQFLPGHPRRRARHGDDRRAAHGGDPRRGRSGTGGHRLGRQQRRRAHRRTRRDREPRRHRRHAARRRRVPPGGRSPRRRSSSSAASSRGSASATRVPTPDATGATPPAGRGALTGLDAACPPQPE